MAVSGLQQRYPPVILTNTGVFSPWGPGVLTPWSYAEDEEASPDALVESNMHQKELKRTQSWGGFSSYTHTSKYPPLLPLESDVMKNIASEPMPSSAPVTPVSKFVHSVADFPMGPSTNPRTSLAISGAPIVKTIGILNWPVTDIDSCNSRLSSKESFARSEGSSTQKTDCPTMYDGPGPVEALSVKQPTCQMDPVQDIGQQQPTIDQGNCTTLALRNLPYSLTREELLEAINASGFSGLYDFVYLPHKFKEHRNLGFAFINFATVEVANQFHAVWHKSRHFKVKGSVKPLNVSVAAVQGRSANELKAHSRKMGRVKNTSYLPVMFDDAGISVSIDNM